VKVAVEDIKKHFVIKEMESMSKYVGCTISDQEGILQIKQPEIIVSLRKKFEQLIGNMKEYNTPAPSHYIVMRPSEGDSLLGDKEQGIFRSGIGTLLYLVKHSRPDIANSVRELSKVMDGATVAHFKMLLRVVKYVVDTKEKCFTFLPRFENGGDYNVIAFCDSDYSGDTETRHSVTGFVIYVNQVAVAWKSKAQRNVTLSSTEAEYVAISETCKEIKFVTQVMDFMGMSYRKPINVHVDNVGAIFMANNKVTSQRTKHVDVRYHFVRELVESGFIQVTFIRSAENDADIFTKNLDQVSFWKHANKLLG
jgi:hypothetical protein